MSDKKAVHSIAKVMAEELACPPKRLHSLTELDWKSFYANIHKTQWLSRLSDVIREYESEKQELAKTLRASSMDDIPDEFLDPIMMTMMQVNVRGPSPEVRFV